MAKKIRLDFSKVEERSGWKTNNIPEGLHEMKIELVDETPANDGTDMLTYGLRPTNPKYKTRLFPYYCKQQANQYFKIRDLFIAAGVLDPKKAKGKAVDLITDAPVGKIVAAEVRDGVGQYSERSEIDGIYDRSIIEDDDDASVDDEEEYDEEAEDEADDEEYEDEEDEEGDDERAEELEGLSLPALRKEAKALDIDTTGLKKAELIEAILEAEEEAEEDDEDEDDLDDEDLEDEELEEEEFEDDEDEEEEAPAPKRRPAAKKPAPKAPAKAAAKAPARRTVKRR